MTYIVRAFSGGPALARTLTSLCYEARDHDEVLVIGDRGRMCAKVLALCDNLESVRFLRNEDWIDEVGNETVCYLREGDQLREGATRAALDALGVCPTSIAGWAGHSCPAERDKSVPPTRPFRLDGPLAESPGWQAVVGEALAVNDRGTLQATRFVPPRSLQQLQTSEVPPAVVFWRRDFLREHRELLGKRFRPGPLLAAARGQVRVIERTLATVDTAVEARYDGPGFAWRLAASLARAVRRFPSAKRAAVKVLPRRLEAVLRGWYVWAVLPQHGRG